MRFFNWLTALALAMTLAGCGHSDQVASKAATDEAVVAQHIAAGPWLRDRLPADTIGYIRLPSLWGLLSAPNGKVADTMFASQAHVDAVAALRAGFATNPILTEVLGTDAADTAIRALNAVAGPIEIAIVSPGRVATPAAQVLITLPLATRDPQVAAAHLGALVRSEPPVFDAQGFATTSIRDTPVAAHFQPDNGRLYLLTGTAPQPGQLQALLGSIESAGMTEHNARVLEREIDEGGQGFVVWLDAQSVKPWLMTSLTGDRLWMRHVFEQTQAFAYGWGGVDGHGRLSLRLQLKDPAWLRYLPQHVRRLDIRSAGEPGFVFAMAVPVAEDVVRILEAVRDDHGDTAIAGWTQVDDEVRRQTGIGVADWLKPFGPELLAFNDDAGMFSALRIHDRAAWQTVLDAVVAKGGTLTSRNVGPGEIHHLAWALPALPAEPGATGASVLSVIAWMQQRPSHAYWIEDGDWLVMASVPQPLIDRLSLGADQTIDSWLAQTQGDDRSDALLSLSGQADDLSRWFYHGYLGLLAALGDIAGAPTDLFALPTARQLGLPRETGIGLQVIANGERLAFDLNYEHVALDGVIGAGGGYAGIAAVAIMAAVAVPAYQDYTMRSTVAEAIAATAPLKIAIAEHYATTGALPVASDVADLLDRAPPGVKANILFSGGAILVRFREDADASIAGRFVYLRPYGSDDGQLHFVCADASPPAGTKALIDADYDDLTTDLDAARLPSTCRP
jgi:hypothetical protein